MNRGQKLIILALIFLGIVIAIAGYYINFYSNPPQYYKRYKLLKQAATQDVGLSSQIINFYPAAKITITKMGENKVLDCHKNYSLLYCDDDFTKSYVILSNKDLPEIIIYSKNTYESTWKTKKAYDQFAYFPNILALDQTLNSLLLKTNDELISEKDLNNIISNKLGNDLRQGNENNYYKVQITKQGNLQEITIAPLFSNKESAYNFTTTITYQKTQELIALEKNTLK